MDKFRGILAQPNWMALNPLNQLDPRWAKLRLGTCSNQTIGSAGCLITAFSLLAQVTPSAMNDALTANGLYWDGCNASTFDIRRAGFNDAPALVGVTNTHQSRPFPRPEYLQLWQHIRSGGTAIACVDMNPTTDAFEQHWIALVGAFGSDGYEDFVISDGWGGVQTTFTSRYKNISRALVRGVMYSGAVSRRISIVADGRQEMPAIAPPKKFWE